MLLIVAFCGSQMPSGLFTLFSLSPGVPPPSLSHDSFPTSKHSKTEQWLWTLVYVVWNCFPTSFLSLDISCFFKRQDFLENTSHLQVIFLAYHLPKPKPHVWKAFKHCQTSKHANSHIQCAIIPTEIKFNTYNYFLFID